MDRPRFTRMGSGNVIFQTHVSEDSRFALLPVLEQASVIKGWVVFDTLEGRVLEQGGRRNDGWFENLQTAREYVIAEFYRR